MYILVSWETPKSENNYRQRHFDMAPLFVSVPECNIN